MNKKRIAVVGGSGFIGTRLVERLLHDGHEVHIFDKNPSRAFPSLWTSSDVRDVDSLIKLFAGIEIVYNLAAEHKDNVSPRSLYDEVNVQGARNVCSAMDAQGVKSLIFTSSVAVYGFAPQNTGEEGAIKPFNDYGRTKWEAEKVYRAWQERDGDRCLSIVRPTVVFGERNRGNVYNLLKQISSGHFVMVGKGINVKSMAYVENVASFLVFLAETEQGLRTFNYIDKPDFDMNSLVEIVNQALERHRSRLRIPFWLGYLGGLCFDVLSVIVRKEFPISAIRVKKFCATTQFDTRVFRETSFRALSSLREGLDRTIHFEFLNRNPKDEAELFYSE